MSKRLITTREDKMALLARESKLRDFLNQTHHLLPNAIGTSNHSFILTRADHWLALCAAKWQLGHPVKEIVPCLNQYLFESLTAVEFGILVSPGTIHHLLSAALTLANASAAHFLASLPDAVWLPAPEARRLIVETRICFALLRGEKVLANRLMELFEGLCFDVDPAGLLTHDLIRARLVHPILASLISRDSRRFDQSINDFLLDPHIVRPRSSIDITPSIDSTAFYQLARWQKMSLQHSHPELLFPGLLTLTSQ